MLPVGEAGVRPHRDLVLDGGGQRGEGGGGVAGVKAAGHVGRADERHQVAVEGTALAQVTVEIDRFGGHGFLFEGIWLTRSLPLVITTTDALTGSVYDHKGELYAAY